MKDIWVVLYIIVYILTILKCISTADECKTEKRGCSCLFGNQTVDLSDLNIVNASKPMFSANDLSGYGYFFQPCGYFNMTINGPCNHTTTGRYNKNNTKQCVSLGNNENAGFKTFITKHNIPELYLKFTAPKVGKMIINLICDPEKVAENSTFEYVRTVNTTVYRYYFNLRSKSCCIPWNTYTESEDRYVFWMLVVETVCIPIFFILVLVATRYLQRCKICFFKNTKAD